MCTNTITETELKDTECDRPCSENHLEFCGGEYSQSYFDTNQKGTEMITLNLSKSRNFTLFYLTKKII